MAAIFETNPVSANGFAENNAVSTNSIAEKKISLANGLTKSKTDLADRLTYKPLSLRSAVLHGMLNDKPPLIVKASGNYLTTEWGNDVFDASGGAAVSCLGHAHPRVCAAINKQLQTVDYAFSYWYTVSASERLATHLCESTGGEMSKVYLTNSGSEAVEAALKMARQYFTEGPDAQPGRERFIARRRCYHGNTLGALAVSEHKARQWMYDPLLIDKISHVSSCDTYRGQKDGETSEQYVSRLATELDDEFQRVGPHSVCGFIIETVPGSSLGISPTPKGYIKAMKDVCDKHGALLILDEVFCGMGRTGTQHSWQAEGVVPHLQTVAKALGAGHQPISALLVNKSVMEKIHAGSNTFRHDQTYQGHPVACAAAYEVQRIIQEENLVENAGKVGEYLGSELKRRLLSHKNVGDIRGVGLMWGIELVEDKATKEPFPASMYLSRRLHQIGLQPGFDVGFFPCYGIYNGTDGDAIMLTPAFNITRDDVDQIVDRVLRVIEYGLGS